MLKFCSQCGEGVSPEDRFCSACGRKLGEEISNRIQTEIHWPLNFYKGDKIEVSDWDIDKYVQKTRERLANSPDETDYTFFQTGNVFVWGYKFEDEIDIFVTKNYFELNGYMDQHGDFEPFEEEA